MKLKSEKEMMIMKKVFILFVALLLSIPVIPAFAEDPVEVRAELTKNIEQIYFKPQMHGITDSCRAKSKEMNADENTMEAYIEKTYSDKNEVLACILGYILYENGKMGAWSNVDVVNIMFEDREKGLCAAIKSDLRNFVSFLETYRLDYDIYPKTADFTIIENGKEKKAFASPLVDYKPSKDYKKYTVAVQSDKCPTIYSKNSDSADIVETKNTDPAKKK